MTKPAAVEGEHAENSREKVEKITRKKKRRSVIMDTPP
jgi:hypothetical protein